MRLPRRRLLVALMLATPACGLPAAAMAAVPVEAVPAAAASCASGPARQDYVSLRRATPSALASAVAACERLGYRPIGGMARALVANPGAPSAEWYYQVLIIPAGASSAAAAASAAAR